MPCEMAHLQPCKGLCNVLRRLLACLIIGNRKSSTKSIYVNTGFISLKMHAV